MVNAKIKNIKKRHLKEKIFKFIAAASIGFSLAFLVILFSMIFIKGKGAFYRSEVALNIDLTEV